MRIQTKRLVLIAATPEAVRADLCGRAELERFLGIAVPVGWSPELWREVPLSDGRVLPEAETTLDGWDRYYVARTSGGIVPVELVGVAAYAGPPDLTGTVEVGCAVLSDFLLQDFETEGVLALTARAFEEDARVRCVVAVVPGMPRSSALEAHGFTRSHVVDDRLRYEVTRRTYRLSEEQEGMADPRGARARANFFTSLLGAPAASAATQMK